MPGGQGAGIVPPPGASRLADASRVAVGLGVVMARVLSDAPPMQQAMAGDVVGAAWLCVAGAARVVAGLAGGGGGWQTVKGDRTSDGARQGGPGGDSQLEAEKLQGLRKGARQSAPEGRGGAVGTAGGGSSGIQGGEGSGDRDGLAGKRQPVTRRDQATDVESGAGHQGARDLQSETGLLAWGKGHWTELEGSRNPQSQQGGVRAADLGRGGVSATCVSQVTTASGESSGGSEGDTSAGNDARAEGTSLQKGTVAEGMTAGKDAGAEGMRAGKDAGLVATEQCGAVANGGRSHDGAGHSYNEAGPRAYKGLGQSGAEHRNGVGDWMGVNDGGLVGGSRAVGGHEDRAGTIPASTHLRKEGASRGGPEADGWLDAQRGQDRVEGVKAGPGRGQGAKVRSEEGGGKGGEQHMGKGSVFWEGGGGGADQSQGSAWQARERRVPSSPLARVWGFGTLAAGLVAGTAIDSARRLWEGSDRQSADPGPLSAFISEKNAERLAVGLCRMRGAALKIGQMLSIQDDSIIPPPLAAALARVRHGADRMPRRQLLRVLESELGPKWQSLVSQFNEEPMAAASIGQVHRAVLSPSEAARAGFSAVAMKVQYPGVAESIDSDIDNMRRLLQLADVVPKGLYLDHAIKIAKVELARECDYHTEASSQRRFRSLLASDDRYYVPRVVPSLSSGRVLTSELVPGVPLDQVAHMSQDVRNRVGASLLVLTLRELFEFRFMQTDPNWSNFLYDAGTDRMMLIDFGAAREYHKEFVDNYLAMVRACADRDRAEVIDRSRLLGFITGHESSVMLDAHVEAAFVVGLPFSNPGDFDFRATDLTRRASALGAVMLRHRLTPPPDEAYSLHRKLSGAFLACIKIGAVIPCRRMLLDVWDRYDWMETGPGPVDEERKCSEATRASGVYESASRALGDGQATVGHHDMTSGWHEMTSGDHTMTSSHHELCSHGLREAKLAQESSNSPFAGREGHLTDNEEEDAVQDKGSPSASSEAVG